MMNIFFVVIMCPFLWAGFICAISFMESWLKFRAPGVTMPIGLSIGQLVFNALNKVEWFLAILISIGLFLLRNEISSMQALWFIVIVAILVTQTAWLLPALNNRAKAVISGKTLPRSMLHWYFVIAEVIKLASLILFGFSLLVIKDNILNPHL
jgi:hypothetical protein